MCFVRDETPTSNIESEFFNFQKKLCFLNYLKRVLLYQCKIVSIYRNFKQYKKIHKNSRIERNFKTSFNRIREKTNSFRNFDIKILLYQTRKEAIVIQRAAENDRSERQ